MQEAICRTVYSFIDNTVNTTQSVFTICNNRQQTYKPKIEHPFSNLVSAADEVHYAQEQSLNYTKTGHSVIVHIMQN